MREEVAAKTAKVNKDIGGENENKQTRTKPK